MEVSLQTGAVPPVIVCQAGLSKLATSSVKFLRNSPACGRESSGHNEEHNLLVLQGFVDLETLAIIVVFQVAQKHRPESCHQL